MGIPVDKVSGIPSVTNRIYDKRKQNEQNAETKNESKDKKTPSEKNKPKIKSDSSRKIDIYI